LWQTSISIGVYGSVVCSIVIFAFGKDISLYFLKTEAYQGVFHWFAIGLVFLVLNNVLLSILNGLKEVKTYVVASAAGSILSLLFTAVMSFKWKLEGALLALALYQSISFFITILLCFPKDWFS